MNALFSFPAPEGPRESSTVILGLQSAAVPELPDLAIVADALHASLAGRRVTSATTPAPLAVRGTPAELAALADQELERVHRRGKFLVLTLRRDRIVISPMLTGRIQLADPAAKHPAKTALVLRFGSRARAPSDAAAWTLGATWIPADGDACEMRYRDPTQMGKVYVLPGGVERPVPGFDSGELGPDADDPELSFAVWRERIRRHPGELKSLLRNQSFVAGIGNAYSDEILWAARLSPFRRRATLAPEEVDELYRAMRETLSDAIDVLRQRVPPTFETQVRDFLQVHLKGGQPCPRCGSRISEVSSRSEPTSYCRVCQR